MDEKSCLEREMRALTRKVELKEDVIRELNRTLLLQRFQQNPESYVRSLTKDSLTSSMDRIGQKVRSFFQKNSEEHETAIENRIEKIQAIHQTLLALKMIELNPQFQKNPRKFLEQWEKTHLDPSQANKIVQEILKESNED